MTNKTSPAATAWPTQGWREGSPEAQGIDPARLAAADDYLAEHVPHIDSLLVIHGGQMVFERYRALAARRALHNVKSFTKSVTSALVGVALHAGDLESISAPLGELLPNAFIGVDDYRKRAITLEDLLTMRSGLAWDEYGRSTVQMTATPDWVRYVLDQPLKHTPGTAYNYSTGNTQLLAAALQAQTGMTLHDYAALYLFEPLGIQHFEWPFSPQGVTVGGSELALTARDMAKFGYLYLRDGVWEGERLLPEGWVAASGHAYTTFDPRGVTHCAGLGYGYLWWLRPQGGYASMIAVGYGGQFAYVIPDLDLVVVMTGDLRDVPEPFRSNEMLCAFNLVEDFIVPAVTGE